MAETIYSAVLVVRQINRLSKDPENQPVIARDAGCVSGLVRFLAETDLEVVEITCDTLSNLASRPENRPLLANEPGLLNSVSKLIEYYPGRRIATLCQGVFHLLIEHMTDTATAKELSHAVAAVLAASLSTVNETSATQQSSSSSSSSSSTTIPSSTAASSTHNTTASSQSRGFRLFSPGARLTETIKVYLKNAPVHSNGEHADLQERLELALIGVAGVISVSVNLPTQTATMYTNGAASQQAALEAISECEPSITPHIIPSSGVCKEMGTESPRGSPRRRPAPIQTNSDDLGGTAAAGFITPRERSSGLDSPKYLQPDAVDEEDNGEWLVRGGNTLAERLAADKKASRNSKKTASRAGFFSKLGKALYLV